MIPSYPSIYNLGHAAVAELFKGPVRIEEKVDGSQISFGLFEIGPGEYDLRLRSKGADINLVAPEGMFKKAVEYVKSIVDNLTPGWIYRGEYLAKPKHNCLAYDRTPKNNIILFDILTGEEQYIDPQEKYAAGEAIDLEVAPTFFEGNVTDPAMLRSFLDRESILGGQKIEGVVIKPSNYDIFGRDKKLLIAKFVSEQFKEVHAADWKASHKIPTNNEIIQVLAGMYATPARWQKALIHLQERGETEGSMRDMQKLIAEIPADVLKECEEEIREHLFKWAWPQLRRQFVKGLPEWYKELLLKKQFEAAVQEEV